MHPILFVIKNYTVASYGLCVLLGAAAVWFYARLLSGKKDDNVFYAYVICMCAAVMGAFLLRPITRVPELIINRDTYKNVPSGVIFDYLFGEIVFYGGLIGGAGALILLCNRFKLSPLPLLDLFAPCVALGHAVGRVGCFLGGCCYGVEVAPSHPLAVRFPEFNAGGAPPGVPVLPVQLIEAVGLLIICAVLTVVYTYIKGCVNITVPSNGLSSGTQCSAAPHPCSASGDTHTTFSTKRESTPFLKAVISSADKQTTLPGITISLYCILYGALRFVLEFYRGDIIRGVYGLFSTSQYISIALFLSGAAGLTFIVRKYRIS